MDGNRALAYINDSKVPFYFKNPITMSMNRRVFKPASELLFAKQVADTRIKVIGSKGTEYFVDPVEKTCTCPGYIYKGNCRHLKELV